VLIPLEATLSIRQRGVALVAALTIVGAVLFGMMSAASAQNYQPSTQPSSVAPSSASTSTGGSALPRTGSSSTLPMAELGAVLVVGGGFLVIASRKRSQRPRATVDA
jgi:LPXTG-motif cell wall-anchored protein